MCFPDVLGWILVNIFLPLLVGGVNTVGVFPPAISTYKIYSFSLNVFGVIFFDNTAITIGNILAQATLTIDRQMKYLDDICPANCHNTLTIPLQYL